MFKQQETNVSVLMPSGALHKAKKIKEVANINCFSFSLSFPLYCLSFEVQCHVNIHLLLK